MLSHNQNLDFKISFYKFTDYLLKEIKKNVVKKRSKLSIENADFTKFTEKEIFILSNISKEMKNTLMAIKNHSVKNVLDEVGKADITYHLNFKVLEKIIKNFKVKCQGITTQRNFLKRLGILERAEIVAKNMIFSKKADLFYRLQKLIGKNEMGTTFKVLLATNKSNNFNLGMK